MATLAHLSDLHFGSGIRTEDRARMLASSLAFADVDHVVVTGDITHRGREVEYEAFIDAFSGLAKAGRLTVIPGNHDRPGDDVADSIMEGERVRVEVRDGLYLVLVDSTGPQNRIMWQGHGMITRQDLADLDAALDAAPDDRLTVVLMHHHPYPLPEEGALEVLASWIGLPYADELDVGPDFLRVVRGRCDLLLHGHRHIPRVRVLDPDLARPLRIYNAGSSSELGRVRVFQHRDGALTCAPLWMQPVPHDSDLRPAASFADSLLSA